MSFFVDIKVISFPVPYPSGTGSPPCRRYNPRLPTRCSQPLRPSCPKTIQYTAAHYLPCLHPCLLIRFCRWIGRFRIRMFKIHNYHSLFLSITADMSSFYLRGLLSQEMGEFSLKRLLQYIANICFLL